MLYIIYTVIFLLQHRKDEEMDYERQREKEIRSLASRWTSGGEFHLYIYTIQWSVAVVGFAERYVSSFGLGNG